MGKLFAAVVTVITLVSTGIFIMRVWWLPQIISAHGASIDRQLMETMVAAGVLFVSSQLILSLFVWQSSDTSRERKIKTFPGGATPMVIFAVVLVGIEVLAMTFVGSKVWASVYMSPPDPDSMVIDLQTGQFAFYFRYAGPDGKFGTLHPDKINEGNQNPYGLDPANDVASRDDIVVGTMTIPVNKPILLTMHSKDVTHSFYVPELRIQQDIVPGMLIPLHFTATKTGRFEIVCTQLCGLGHYNMRAFLEVVPQDQFDQWLKAQSQ